MNHDHDDNYNENEIFYTTNTWWLRFLPCFLSTKWQVWPAQPLAVHMLVWDIFWDLNLEDRTMAVPEITAQETDVVQSLAEEEGSNNTKISEKYS